MPVDPIALTADLIRCPSVTPVEGGALQLLDQLLSEAGFETWRVDRADTPNLYARWGVRGAKKSFGFNGHTDVVPVGDAAAWSVDPFGGEIRDGILYGRGATDMKSGVAAFTAAAIDFVQDTPPDGAIILAITGDEEGPSTDGTIALLDWMQANHETMTACIVGEPTCPDIMGEMIKVGRRGSLTSHFTATGKQGHSAYPHRAKNPLPAMVRLLDRLASHEMDKGSDYFDPSTLAVVTIDTGNPATNVIPATCKASANVRFNDLHTSQSVIAWMQAEVDAVAADFNVKIDMASCVSGESFITPPGELSDLVSAAVRAETGIIPKPSTTGGTSDARFVKNHCPVVEVGLVGKTMHQVDECVPVGQITQLTAIYGRILRDYFS
jgi:succinyl-diaminopimelate desuccinylase